MSLLNKSLPILKPFIRHKSQRLSLGKPPGVARSLKERLAEINYKDPEIHYKVDIGFCLPKVKRKEVLAERISIIKRNKNDPDFEKQSRLSKLEVPLKEVQEEWSGKTSNLIRAAAVHYGIFDHLYGDAYFNPALPLKVFYKNEDQSFLPVYRGNLLSPVQAKDPPEVNFESPDKSLWTLVFSSPDGNLTNENSEYILWLVGNIKGNNLNNGQEIVKYLQPFPLKGIGYCRYIFVLYKQEGQIDFSSLQKSLSSSDNPEGRNFSSYDFYHKMQDVLTPAGLAFFQSEWDSSVRQLFHERFNQLSPEFSYDFPAQYYTPQKWFPLRQPFNLYLDRYRDQKQIAKEFLIKKLKKVHPFRGIEPDVKYPNAIPFQTYVPSWLKNEIRKERLKWGRINDV